MNSNTGRFWPGADILICENLSSLKYCENSEKNKILQGANQLSRISTFYNSKASQN
jgi:hypothetical protein